MKNINFKLRLKNGYTATGLLSTLVIFLKEITGAFGLDLSTQIDQYASGVGAILAFLTAIGVIVDGTTKGFGDSKIAKQYSRPRTDYDPKQALDWQINVEKKAKAREQARKEQDEKLKLEEYERQKENEKMIEKEPKDEKAIPIDNQNNDFEPEQWKDDFAEEVEVEEGLRDVEDDDVIVDNFDSDINNSGVMLDTNQQVEGAIENGENTSTDK